MKSFDVAVIGGGLLGCLAARSLMRYRLSALLIEGGEDLCSGITRANAAVIYSGYDNKPGSLKAQMCVRANAGFDRLCQELELDFVRRGSLLLSYDEACDRVLEKKLRNGRESGVPGLRMLSGQQALEMEPMLSAIPRMALYCPGTGTVNPWQLGIAAFENAVKNGCEAMLGTSVLGIEKSGERYIIKSDREEISCRAVINCAGLFADKVREMLFEPDVRLFWDASDFVVFDRNTPAPSTILMQERPSGKGISLVPTVEGSLLLEGPARELRGELFSFRRESREELLSEAQSFVNGLREEDIIRCFGAVRPNPRHVKKINGEYVPDEKDISSFVIDRPEPGFVSLIGIKTPGLSCADELGRHVSAAVAEYLGAEENRSFDPHRPAIKQLKGLDINARQKLIEQEKDYGEIICLCEGISKAEIKQAIARGAKSVEAVKRRLGTALGSCQGSRCNYAISKMLEVEK